MTTAERSTDEPAVDVFVYGTLTDPDQADAILDGGRFVGAAEVVGLHRVEGAYPTLAPGGRTKGQVLRTLEVDRLDAYEGVDGGLYCRLSLPLSEEEWTDESDQPGTDMIGETVEVYVGDPDRLDAPVTWPGSGPFADRVRAYVEDRGVVVRRLRDRQD